MKTHKMTRKVLSALFFLLVAGIFVSANQADSGNALSAGQTVYVPIYSHIYSGLKGRPFNLAATLSIRNTDPKHAITLVSVKFYDSEGKLVKAYLDNPAELKAMASTRYILTEADTGGGSGANFLVKWNSKTKVNPPLIEGVMIGTRSGQGISFVSRGQVIEE
jgi:spore germination protein YaaH